jgi:hypothetical protein
VTSGGTSASIGVRCVGEVTEHQWWKETDGGRSRSGGRLSELVPDGKHRVPYYLAIIFFNITIFLTWSLFITPWLAFQKQEYAKRDVVFTDLVYQLGSSSYESVVHRKHFLVKLCYESAPTPVHVITPVSGHGLWRESLEVLCE